ncbi:glycoside hydrolase family 3 protein [Candidatus Poriferisodalis sp.]|uniref:glycoside hydrolase family 3 protein n=1 Tax=Candidatus Poriferisodalis sp. TaxID=3101277 RepID=UPI003B0162B2
MRRRLAALIVLALAAVMAAVACSSDELEARDLTLPEAVGQMLLFGFPGTDVEPAVAELLDEVRPAGLIVYDYDVRSGGTQPRNIVSPDQLAALTASLQEHSDIGLLIAVDAEGGLVNRLKQKYGFPVAVPSAAEMGAGDAAETSRIAAELARELRAAGINWNLAPVVDVDVYPDSPAIGALGRAFSADPAEVAAHAGAFADAMHAESVVPTLKHFPGHGSAVGDTHLGVTDVTDSFVREVELAPYRTLFEQDYAGAVMTNHVVNRTLDPSALPATLSTAVVTGLLRNELGFEGVVISDDMGMGAIVEEYTLEHAAVRAVIAGVDVVLLANQIQDDEAERVLRVRDAILAAVESGEIPEERIYESAQRVLELKRRYGLLD